MWGAWCDKVLVTGQKKVQELAGNVSPDIRLAYWNID